MTGATVSDAYLLGISEGRDLLRTLQAQGGYNPAIDAPAMLASARLGLKGQSGTMAQVARGEIDFWRNQCAKLQREGVSHAQA